MKKEVEIMMQSSLHRLKIQTKNESITESDMEEFDDLLSTDDEVEADSGPGAANANENLSDNTSQLPQVAEQLNTEELNPEQVNAEQLDQLDSMQNDVPPANTPPTSVRYDSNDGFGPQITGQSDAELWEQLNFDKPEFLDYFTAKTPPPSARFESNEDFNDYDMETANATDQTFSGTATFSSQSSHVVERLDSQLDSMQNNKSELLNHAAAKNPSPVDSNNGFGDYDMETANARSGTQIESQSPTHDVTSGSRESSISSAGSFHGFDKGDKSSKHDDTSGSRDNSINSAGSFHGFEDSETFQTEIDIGSSAGYRYLLHKCEY